MFDRSSVYRFIADIDECTRGTHTCQSGRAVCRNTQGSYECDCLSGYVRDVSSAQTCNGMYIARVLSRINE